uniref:Uncharacterized protein n=1 Tax=Setaria italica TaxID=4555 RepID=K4A447_SETIT
MCSYVRQPFPGPDSRILLGAFVVNLDVFFLRLL